MRNLKKALALVLALMMALSLMSFASAADYADGNEIEQNEAVDVMSALGVFKGTDGGNFDPDGTLTRAQAAKIITYMLLGQEVADSLPNTGSKFADCPDGRWYVGSVNYLTDLGIVAGRSETTFDPNGSVTGYEFAKMLLGALGYDSKTEQFEGTSAWSINIATTARRAGLGEGLAVSAISSVPLTREQASKLSFNTLTATMVYYQGGVSVGDVTVNPTRYTVANSKSNDYNTVIADQDELMQFCEQYFPTLKYTSNFSAEDDFGRKLSKQWKVGDDAAYTGAADPIVVYDTTATAANIEKDLKAAGVVADSTGIKSITNKTAAVSADIKGATLAATASTIAGKTAPGKVVEVYKDGATNKISSVIITEYTVESVKNIVEKNGETIYTFSVTSGSFKNNEDNTNVVVSGTVAKDDVVTTVKLGSKIYVYPTTSFTGSQTAKKGNTVTIDGATYDIGTGVTGVTADNFVNSAKDQTYYVDVNGYLVKVVGEAAPAAQYGMIVSTAAGSSAPTLDNPAGYTVNVRVVLADGSIEDRTLAASVVPTPRPATGYPAAAAAGDLVCGDLVLCTNSKLGALPAYVDKLLTGATYDDVDSDKLPSAAGTGKLFGYTINDDGKMVLSTVTDAPANSKAMEAETTYQANLSDYSGANTVKVNTDKTFLFTNNTKFVLYSKDSNGKWVTEEVKTGLSNLSVTDADGVAIVKTGDPASDTNAATLVFLNTSSVAQTTDEYVFIDASEYTDVLGSDGKTVKQWTGIAPDGSEVLVTGSTDVVDVDGLYVYDTDKKVTASKVDVDAAAASPTNGKLYYSIPTAASVTGNLLEINTGEFVNMTDDTQVVYLDENLSEISGNVCLVVMEPKAGGAPENVATVYVVKAYVTPAPSIQYVAPTAPSDLDMNGNGSGTEKTNADVAITVTTPAGGTGVTIKSVSSSDSTKVAVAEKTEQSMPTVTLTAKGEANDITITVVLQCEGYSDTTVTFTVDVANS